MMGMSFLAVRSLARNDGRLNLIAAIWKVHINYRIDTTE